MKIVWLSRRKVEKTLTNEEYYKKYSYDKLPIGAYHQYYKMLSGTPIVVNICGVLVDINDLCGLCYYSEDKELVNKYIQSVKSADNGTLCPDIEFKWSNK